MSEQLIDLLKLGLIALLYLFFLRVIWAVWTELRAPAIEPRTRRSRQRAARPAGRSRGQVSMLRVLEPAEIAGDTYPLSAEMTMGRAPGCTVVIDDTYVSQVHARVFGQDGGWHVEDLGSTNGTFCNGDAVSSPRPLRPGDRVQVGNVVLELA